MTENPEDIKTLESEVKAFVNAQPYWAKYICCEILSGNEITDEKIETTFSFLLEELSLKEETTKPELSITYNPNATDDFKEELTFDALIDVEGVNALKENQRIELTPNLTILYGVNGAGKSGYIRLLKNSFYSKDKEQIVENVNQENANKPISAQFHFSTNGTHIPLKYPEDLENGIFNQFAVFDGEIGKRHLKNRNDFSFRPAGLRLFNEFNSVLEKLNNRLIIEARSKSTLNPFANDDIFQGESEIKNFLSSLSHNSKLIDLQKHLPFTEEEKTKKLESEKKYDDLKIALSQKDKTLKELTIIREQLTARQKNLEITNLWFAQTQLESVNNSISDCNTKKEIATKQGIEKFKSEKINNIGSEEWKVFIQAAEKFALKQTNNDTFYPEIGDNCLLCQQPINEDLQKNLIQSYWAYIASVAEQEAKTAIEDLDKTKEGYEKLDFNQFPESDILSSWLKENNEEALKYGKQILENQNTLSLNIIDAINKNETRQFTEIKTDLSIFDNVLNELNTRIKALEENEQNKILELLLKEKTYLAHKEKLSIRYTEIETLHKNIIWVHKSNSFNKQWHKTQSTNTEKRLSNDYFNSDYINAFNQECDSLNGKFGIIIDAKSFDAQSNRQLFLKGKDPSAILSEGEQKVIALADFIAETNITTINKGIVFDDPVTSLDEERKSTIAKRLVDLSTQKQVVIFTHDLVFVSSLINFAGDNNVPNECHWIENRNGIPGQVWLRNSPTYEKVYRNSEPAKEFYKVAKEDDCPPAEREYQVRNGFTALRTCYEVLVINDLFKNVVQRYNERVSVDSLSSVYFDEELINELLESFAQCCRYMEGHTHSDKYAYLKPEPQNLNEEIQRYETIRSKIKKNDTIP
ncbi:hypothetical protein HCG49_12675 [Arenibacter sp. 6A1]|uniref:AAA family ATPase n=1 Tax=Arenibacter sp. 6A1 TaxID=2720391 RepID=UPI0014474672|nr:AAA family ATPase [Arenibacter sp. 6A1]NKI27417.1 hypothetical protein [Arenibacter sp. 6A1]